MSYFTSFGEVKNPGLYKRKRVYADLDYSTKLTQQQFKDDCDINNIMRRYTEKGILPDLIAKNPIYGDFSSMSTFQDALNVVTHAQSQFDALSAEQRARFQNDPSIFLEFVNDPNNLPELVKMGLASEVVPTPPSPIETSIKELTATIKESSGFTKDPSSPPKGKPTK